MTFSNNKPLIFIHINFSYHPSKTFLEKTQKLFTESISNENSLVYTLGHNKFAPLENTIQDYHKQSGSIGASKYHQKLFSQKMILDQNRKCLILINRHLLDDFIRRSNFLINKTGPVS
ncbi:unnamed protein product [Rhizophagus irregularis]|uniref:Uncharacterized protein n=1 Tax=Rhizophagus irregularis TaxID=588596 RepID=A0A2I1GA28_9GLOM|nr:hypothetical protein RhiirA4_457473 [Rhizophagus irregularis]CAB4427315.1 unnamed protein product [Rhizophagus irregularis]